jgi:hypothetical protein
MYNFDGLSEVFVQEYFSSCDVNWMVGTKEFPCYVVGYLEKSSTYDAYVVYPLDVGNSRPGFITPSFVSVGRCNLVVGDRYIIGATVEECLDGYEDKDVYRYKIGWSNCVEVVIADNDSSPVED